MILIYEIPWYERVLRDGWGTSPMNEYDEKLYVRMIVARLPEGVTWDDDDRLWVDDDELLADDVEDESDVIDKYGMKNEWSRITADAWEEWCACTANDVDWLAAAEKYDVWLPDGYNPGWDDETHDARCCDGDDDDDI